MKDISESRDLAEAHPDLVERAAKLMAEARTEDPNWPMVDRKRRVKQ